MPMAASAGEQAADRAVAVHDVRAPRLEQAPDAAAARASVRPATTACGASRGGAPRHRPRRRRPGRSVGEPADPRRGMTTSVVGARWRGATMSTRCRDGAALEGLEHVQDTGRDVIRDQLGVDRVVVAAVRCQVNGAWCW